jgi:tetratricopeptide (TPR) repeat protein
MAKRSKKKGAGGLKVAVDSAVVAQSAPSWLSRDWLLGLILLVAVILTYSPVWWAGYIWDDDLVVTANHVIVGPLGLKEIWTTSAADICPLTLTTFWVEHALWGTSPLLYHLVNVLLHGACAILLWRVLRSLQVPGAWLGAALWALHPVMVESVAWITEMKNTESGLFFLLSILFFVKDLRTAPSGKRGIWNRNHALTLLFAALAMTAKSSTVILPLVLCLCAWWAEGRWKWLNLARIAPIFLMSIAAGLVSIWTLNVHGADDPQWARSWPERLVTAGDAVWFYLGKLLWPHPLMAIYPRWQVDASVWFSYLPALAVILVGIVLWRSRESWARPWFFALGYFLAAVIPVLGVFDNYIFCYSLVFDHFQYLASMGPLALAGAGIVWFSSFLIPRKRWLQATLGAGMLLILGISSWQRVWVYENEETLWTDTLTKNPNCWLGYNNLGEAVLQKGQVDEAIEQYQKALSINRNYDIAHNNIGTALLQKGQVDEAINQYQKALEIDPGNAKFHHNLGGVLLQKGEVDEAIGQYQKALEIDPNDANSHNNLGRAFAQKGQMNEAMTQFQETLKINPDYDIAHNNLGNVLLQGGRVDEAIAHYQKALEINPLYVEAHSNLGIAFTHKGRMDEAMAQFQEVLRLEPNNPAAQANLTKAQEMAQRGAGKK